MKSDLYIDPELSAQMRIVAQTLDWVALKPNEKLRAVSMDTIRKLQDHLDALRQTLMERTSDDEKEDREHPHGSVLDRMLTDADYPE